MLRFSRGWHFCAITGKSVRIDHFQAPQCQNSSSCWNYIDCCSHYQEMDLQETICPLKTKLFEWPGWTKGMNYQCRPQLIIGCPYVASRGMTCWQPSALVNFVLTTLDISEPFTFTWDIRKKGRDIEKVLNPSTIRDSFAHAYLRAICIWPPYHLIGVFRESVFMIAVKLNSIVAIVLAWHSLLI